MEKIGAFLCTGCDIGSAIKADDLKEVAEENGAGSFVSHPCLCGPEGVEQISKGFADGEFDGALPLRNQ